MALDGVRLQPSGLGRFAPALGSRNYCIYTAGNSVSLIGTWLQRVAVGWVAWTLTHSGTWLGLVSFADLFPVVFLSPLAGALADRRDRVAIVRVTQIAGSIQAAVLAALVFFGSINIHTLFALTFLLGIVNAIAQPARLALIPTLVERPALPSAVAINAIVFNSARFIGPAVAGIVIAYASVGMAFALNAASYVVFLVALLNLRGVAPLPVGNAQNALKASAEAYRYVAHHHGIAPMMLLFLVTCIGTRGFVELFPGFADSVFGRGPEALSMLTSAVGLGAILGGLYMLRVRGVGGLTRLVLFNTLVISIAILLFTATDNFYFALPCVFIAGMSMVLTGIAAQTLIQTAVDPAMRGRVMALYGMVFRAGPAIGALLAGILSERLGLRLPLAVGAVISCLFWVWVWLRREEIRATLETEEGQAVASRQAERSAREVA